MNDERREWKLAMLASLEQEYADCDKCPRMCNPPERTRKRVILGSGNVNAKILIVEEAPSLSDEREGVLFSDNRGAMLQRLLRTFDLDLDTDVYTVPVVSCVPTDSDGKKRRAPSAAEIRKCGVRLSREIDIVDPAIIVLMGAVPFKMSGQSSGFATHAKKRDHPLLSVKTFGTCRMVTRPAFATYSPLALLAKKNQGREEYGPLHMTLRTLERAALYTDQWASIYRGTALPERTTVN